MEVQIREDRHRIVVKRLQGMPLRRGFSDKFNK